MGALSELDLRMPEYRVQVASRKTGKESTLLVNAQDERHAAAMAEQDGWLVGRVEAETPAVDRTISPVAPIPMDVSKRGRNRKAKSDAAKEIRGLRNFIALLVLLGLAAWIVWEVKQAQRAGEEYQRDLDKIVSDFEDETNRIIRESE